MICEVCEHPLNELVLDLGSHPLCDDLMSIGSSEHVPEYQQLISLCRRCLTAHQLVPVEKEKLFKPSYHYRAALTSDVLSGMQSLVDSLHSEMYGFDTPAVVLDIGCNDGSLLGMFKNTYECLALGVDPTGAILEAGEKIDFGFNEYFSEQTVRSIKGIAPVVDIITFTNVFAHIENLPELLKNLGSLMSDSTLLIIENHYLGSILERNQFDTFYHEHPRTYSLRSFQHIAKTLGLTITHVEFPSRYGGNIRVIMKKYGLAMDLSSYSQQEDDFILAFDGLQKVFDDWKFVSKEKLRLLSTRGSLYGKSLPGRAVMLLNALNLNEEMMPVVFEQPNSPKVGNYIPGTKIEVHADDEISAIEPEVLVVWAWHIVDEIVNYLDSLGYRGEIWVPLPEFRMYRPAL
jgi:hypothetical protein